ncbi:hypothetical protein [Streptomyces sp. S.PNR 29]|uniref:hypothetical protein n=1 Tax=Streptomyces sp. S.PNR 29 TaxID=2973805 RepID=UPI0025AF2D5A|nr:hypothetical protein [Streptomyces sp. S.PNR 29]MDN0195360.1 hypothetical protein [Streptomyces sp. S.PNR 29]
MARRVSLPSPTAQRALVALATAGMALGAGAATASAGTETRAVRAVDTALGKIDPQVGLRSTAGTVGHVTGPAAELQPNPLAGTGSDPLDNGVNTQVADFKPVNSQGLTRPVAQAESVGDMPAVGPAVRLPGGVSR